MTNDEIGSLFLPHLTAAAQGVRNGQRLVHYTSAEAAFRIISGKEVWLRNANLMNDYLEIRHGLNCLQAAWNSDAGQRLREWLRDGWNGLDEELQKTFDGHSTNILDHTYILSLSAHDNDEDKLGRLSMWRAYGGYNGVALVLNTGAFQADTDELSVFSTPVIYQDVDEYTLWFAEWVDGVISFEIAIKQLDRQTFLNVMFFFFRMTLLAVKHPGFREEQEWRIFHSPLLDGPSDWVRIEPEVINGVPQPVVKLKLFDDQSRGIEGVAPNSLVNRVIIGPCENPAPIRNALWSALENAGVEDIADKIWMSFIPLRQR